MDVSGTGLITSKDVTRTVASRGHILGEEEALLLVKRIARRKKAESFSFEQFEYAVCTKFAV